MSKLDSREGVREYVDRVSLKRRWKLNPDERFVDPILDGLSKNFARYGCLACPCRDVEGVKEKDRDIVCPCVYAAADIEEFGQCYCGLFLGSGKDPQDVSSIPERRPEA